MSTCCGRCKNLHELRRFHRARVRILHEEYTRICLPKMDIGSSDTDYADYRFLVNMKEELKRRYEDACSTLNNVELAYRESLARCSDHVCRNK